MAELAFAGVSLTFQVFSGCVQGYELITDAKNMPADCQYLRVRLKTEQYRLLDWASVVHLDESDEALLISNSSKGLLLDVLDQQRGLLHQFGRLDEKYKKLSKPLLVDYVEEHQGLLPAPPQSPESPQSPGEEGLTIQRADSDFRKRFPQSQHLLRKSLEWARKSTSVPRKFKWASWDKAKMEVLVLKLTSFNDFMRDMLNTAQLESLAIKQERTESRIMQLNSSVQYLAQIIESTTLRNNRGHGRTNYIGRQHAMNPMRAILSAQGLEDHDDDANARRPSGGENLASLAQLKALNSALSDPSNFTDEFTSSIALPHTASETLNVELDRSHIRILDSSSTEDDGSESHRVEAFYQPPHSRKTSVWIEWKTYEPPPFYPTGPDPKIHERVKALAALLKEHNSIAKFRAPHCLGYFLDTDPETDEDHCRFGLVFEKPASAHPSTKPVSLHSLLVDPAVDMPSLTDRISLMRMLSETLARLHVVNWLHKGLRSSNILFFSDCGPAEIDYADPYISGFDYSRPALNDDMTEKPPENAATDVYRHPNMQGSGSRDGANNFKKTYDLYSLGVILLEIAYWKPIDQILDIPNLKQAKPSVVFKVRKRLLDDSEGFLKYVKSHLGNTVQAVIRACLVGPRAFGLEDNADEKKEEVAEQLQEGFYDHVVKEFGEMRI